MRFNWNYLKLIGLSAILAALYSFAHYRNSKKKIDSPTVNFVGQSNLYLTEEAVNNLLKQNHGNLTNTFGETVTLHDLETTICSNPMVKSAQVYRTIPGKLIADIVQRQPLGRVRVQSSTSFYIDDTGARMPLSTHHSARVPLITGNITEKTLQGAYTVLNHINADDFLKKNSVGIHITNREKYQLKLRLENFTVHLGTTTHLNAKLKNFKAFYAKAVKDHSLQNYASVNLEFNNQVVCTTL